VRGQTMGPGKYENVGKSQSVLIMINPMNSPRARITRREAAARRAPLGGSLHTELVMWCARRWCAQAGGFGLRQPWSRPSHRRQAAGRAWLPCWRGNCRGC
jgi:hypothetical protein